MRYILITGASSGLGRELAIELSKNNSLILTARNFEELKKTKELCNGSHDVKLWEYDLCCIEKIENDLKEILLNEDINVEGFVHCAGVTKLLPCKNFSYETFETIFKVNVFSAALIIKVLSSRRINGKYLKSVVFISSNISIRGAKTLSIYGSSKSALDGLMKSLSVELAPNTRVNSVLPGAMITEMTEEMFCDGNLKENNINNTPLGLGSPKKVVPMIDFLLSEKSNWITGQQFVVDGGRTVDITEKRI